jgi:hypothetical protein
MARCGAYSVETDAAALDEVAAVLAQDLPACASELMTLLESGSMAG